MIRIYRTFHTAARAVQDRARASRLARVDEADRGGRGTRTIRTEALARVEGEGAMQVRIRGGEVENVELQIYEPPRFFEAFLRGRDFAEAPDITARICGICPVAYMTSAFNAMEDALEVEVGRADRGPAPAHVLRRVDRVPRPPRLPAARPGLLRLRLGLADGARSPRGGRGRACEIEGDGQRAAAGDRRPRDPPDQHPGRRLLQGAAEGRPRGARPGPRGVAGVHARRRSASSPASTSPTSSRTTSSSRSAIPTATRSRTGGWSPAPASTSGRASTRSTSPSSRSRTRPRSSRG